MSGFVFSVCCTLMHRKFKNWRNSKQESLICSAFFIVAVEKGWSGKNPDQAGYCTPDIHVWYPVKIQYLYTLVFSLFSLRFIFKCVLCVFSRAAAVCSVLGVYVFHAFLLFWFWLSLSAKIIKWKKVLREMQTLRMAVVRRSQKFSLLQTPFLGVQDGQNLISWRWSLPLPTNPVWRGSMHTISN